jgi:CRISPR-associated endonuclease Cas3-HD
MRGCYAYKKGEKAEGLAEHLAEVAKRCMERGLLDPVASKIAKEYSKPKEYVRDLIVASCLLHDLGKADKIYQESCDKGCEDFSGHDVRGYKLVCTAIKRLGYNDEDEVLRVDLLVPILMHHYFQRSLERLWYDLLSIGDIHIWPPCAEDLPAMLKGKIDLFESREVRELVEEVAKLIGGGHIVLVATNSSRLLEELQRYTAPFWKLAAMAVTAILNDCDGSVAHARRR